MGARYTVARAAYLEPHEPEPADLMDWLAKNWGFDPTRPIERIKDKDGWWWFSQQDRDEFPL
jgi:hypothetical protein